MTETDVARLVELSEARAYASFVAAAPPAVAQKYGFRVATIGCTVAIMADSVTASLNLNRVIGLGVAESATEEMVDRLCSQYVTPFGIELSPASKPGDLPQWLKARRLRKAFVSRILYRDGSPPRDVYGSWAKSTGLRVEQTGPESAAALAKLSCENFRMPESVQPVIEGTARQPGWRHWVAFDGDLPVGGSLSYAEGGVCWLGWTSVLPSHRGRWVHAGIVAKELQEAHQAGCDWVTTETASGTEKSPDPAFHNLKNFGFREAYLRPVYAGRPPARS
jgi:GNAT superfamily N-acetyltransferase